MHATVPNSVKAFTQRLCFRHTALVAAKDRLGGEYQVSLEDILVLLGRDDRGLNQDAGVREQQDRRDLRNILEV